jgi:hypothetical protein
VTVHLEQKTMLSSPLNEHIEPSDAEFEIIIDTDLLQYDLEYDSDPEDEDTTMDLEEEETLPGFSDLESLKRSYDLHVLHEGMLLLPLNVSKRLASSISS